MNFIHRALWKHRYRTADRLAIVRQARSQSSLEVERKFVPAPGFHGKVKALVEASLKASSHEVSWHTQKRIRIRDTYFDLNDQLSRKGIWIRYRTVSPAERQSPPAAATWDAKVRVGGDFIGSEFIELEGEHQIRSLLSERLPGTELDDLDVLVDLETIRSGWTVTFHDEQHARGNECISVVLDLVTSSDDSGSNTGANAKFEHVIGEIEMNKEIETNSSGMGDSNEHGKERTGMREKITAFMDGNTELFAAEPPVGKLSAYFKWKQQRSNQATQQRTVI